MDLNPVPAYLSDLSTLKYNFFTVQFNSRHSQERILIVAFDGVYGVGSAGNGDAGFMDAIVDMGKNAFDPAGIVLDFRQLRYEWGDLMAFPIGAADIHGIAPAIVVSDLCREAMTSFVQMEMSANPSDWLFEDLRSAIQKVEAHYNLHEEAAKFLFPNNNERLAPEQFEEKLRDETFRRLVASKYDWYAPLRVSFRSMKSLLLADAKEAALEHVSADVFETLAHEFLARFEGKALDAFLEALSYGIPTEHIDGLETLAIPLLDMLLDEVARRMELQETDSATLRKAQDLFHAARKKRIELLRTEFEP
jgi:hypothetical protein